MPDEVFTLGVDIGSTASKAVVLEGGKKIVATAVVPVGAGTTGPARAMAAALEASGMELSAMHSVCATGYGRNSFEQAAFEVSELSCHVKGAHLLFPDVRTVLDIGGQDVKAIRVADGRLVDFVMNDKCAAGTGRFLDVMARVLEVKVSDLAQLDAQSTHQVNISSTCTVFAESEVISQLARKAAREDVIAGIHRSVASRAIGLAKRVGVHQRVVMSGGVAQNAGVVRCLEKGLDTEISTSPLSQLFGALGAAVLAYERVVQPVVQK